MKVKLSSGNRITIPKSLIDELNLVEIFKDLGKICKTPNVCGNCADKSCLTDTVPNQ